MHTRRTRIALTVATTAAIVLSFTGLVDARGSEYADEALKRALVTFAVARTLNGVISVAQGTELNIQPAGVGVTLLPGQILDPINDLVERFSWIMLAASTSLGIQSVLLRMSAWWGVTAFVLVAGAALVVAMWWPGRTAPRWLVRLAAGAMFVRLAVPLLVVLTSQVSALFLYDEQTAATAALRETSAEIESLSERADREAAPEEESLVGRLSSFVGSSLESMEVDERIRAFRERLGRTSEEIVDLIVAFTLETVLIPLAFLWLLARTFRFLGGL